MYIYSNFERNQPILLKDAVSLLPILRYYKELHTVYERFLLNKWNSVKIIDELYFILGNLSQYSLMLS
jgi:hypothetical protein